MRLELTHVGLLVELANHYTTRGTYKCPGYDSKQSDGEATVMLELWGMWSTLLLPLLPALEW